MLQTQNVDVLLTQGVDTRTDEKLVVPGKLLELRNARFRGGTLAKAFGCEALSDALTGGGSVTGAQALATLGDALLRFDTTGYLRARLGDGTWTPGRGSPVTFYTARKTPVTRGADASRGHDVLSTSGLTFLVHRRPNATNYSLNDVLLSVLDEATGTLVAADVLVAEATLANAAPRLARVTQGAWGTEETVVLLWADGANLNSAQVRVAAPTAVDFVHTERTDFSPGQAGLDVVSTGTALEVLYATNGTNYTLLTLSVAAHAAASVVNTAVAAGDTTRLALLRFADASLGVLHNSGAGLSMRRHTAAHAVAAPVDTVLSGAGLLGWPAYVSTDGGATYTVWGLLSNASTVHHLHEGQVSSAGAGGSFGYTQGVRPVGQPAVVGGHRLLPVAYTPLYAGGTTEVQPTAFVLDWDSPTGAGLYAPVARLLDGVHTPLPAGFALPHSAAAGSAARFFLLEKGRVAVESDSAAYGVYTVLTTVDRTQSGLSLLEVEACSAADVSRVELGGVLHVAGAAPAAYDGARLLEEGFHAFPQGLATADSATAGSLVAGKVYGYCAVYEWVDARGRRHQSAPSPAVFHTVGAGKTSVSVTVPCLGLTRKWAVAGETPPSVVLYRTEDASTVFYRTSALATPTLSSHQTTRVVINDGTSDAALVANEVLATTGGALEALPPPAHTFAWAHQGALFLGGLEDAHEVRYSLEAEEGEGLVFNEVLGFRLPEARGALTAGASMDGRLVLFTRSGIAVDGGVLPNRNGEQGSLGTNLQWLLTDVGCVDWRTVVEVPQGLLFQSPRGFCLLTRGFEVQPLADADGYRGLVVVRATRLDAAREVRFLTAAGLTVVFDYEYGGWWLDEVGGEDALLHLGRYVRADSGTLYRDSDASDAFPLYGRGGAAYGWRARTGWLKVAGLQGVQRVRRLAWLGRLASAADVTVRVYFDYRTDAGSEVVTATLDTATHAGGVAWLRHHLAHQKCTALCVEVEVGASTTEGLSLTALTLEAGVARRGLSKLPSARTV